MNPEWKPTLADLKGLYQMDRVMNNGLTLECYCEEADPDVGIGASITLYYVLCDGNDIAELFDDVATENLCWSALQAMENDREDEDYDRGADRYEDRRGV